MTAFLAEVPFPSAVRGALMVLRGLVLINRLDNYYHSLLSLTISKQNLLSIPMDGVKLDIRIIDKLVQQVFCYLPPPQSNGDGTKFWTLL